MTDYDNDKDLAEILIEGIKVKYGSEKADQVKKEFLMLEKLNYRRNAEDLTAVVNRVCLAESEVLETEVVQSIDDVVYQKPSMLKVAVKGTANLAKKSHLHQWYYPIVGALPAKYQEKIAKSLGDDPIHYTKANMAAETITTSLVAAYITLRDTQHSNSAIVIGALTGFVSAILNYGARKDIYTKNNYSNVAYKEPAGSMLITLPYYAILYSLLAIKSTPRVITSAGVALKNVVKSSYISAYKELEAKQNHQSEEAVKLTPAKPIPTKKRKKL